MCYSSYCFLLFACLTLGDLQPESVPLVVVSALYMVYVINFDGCVERERPNTLGLDLKQASCVSLLSERWGRGLQGAQSFVLLIGRSLRMRDGWLVKLQRVCEHNTSVELLFCLIYYVV